MASFFYRFFSGTCQVGAVGGLLAAAKYRWDYNSVPTDRASTEHALTRFAKDDRRDIFDVAIVGGGIVGVATAREIRARYPGKRVILLEKEADVAQHQSGHNSGCIHAGMFYPPGTAMARLCPRGHDLIIDYCKRNNLPYELCGKLVVAVNESQVPSIEQLYEFGTANKVKGLQLLRGAEAIQKKEPLVNGVVALWSPFTGITDFAEITRHMLKELCAGTRKRFEAQFQFEALDFTGVQINAATKDTPEEFVLIRGREPHHLGPEKTILAKHVITCCGLSNDLLAKRSGSVLEWLGRRVVQTYSFRGRYYQMTPEKRSLVNMHVYPAPDNSKGLSVGVHFTPTVDVRRGRQLILGPGSAVALDRYGYTGYSFDPLYTLSCAFSRGGWVSLFSNFNVILQTYYMDLSESVFLSEAQKLIPTIEKKDIEDSFTGVMGVGVGTDGSLCSDLAMEFARPRVTLNAKMDSTKALEPVAPAEQHGGSAEQSGLPLILNVRNAPSPAATASMSIAEDIVAAAGKKFQW